MTLEDRGVAIKTWLERGGTGHRTWTERSGESGLNTENEDKNSETNERRSAESNQLKEIFKRKKKRSPVDKAVVCQTQASPSIFLSLTPATCSPCNAVLRLARGCR